MSPIQDKKIRVLVVDDSAFMRVALKKMMEADPDIEVIGVARNGHEAIQKIGSLKPDIVTMDIEMPVMNGLEALEYIMDEMPLPVIMISALTEEGADATFQALDIGAVDFIPKGGKSYVNLDIVKVGEQLRQKVHAIVARNRYKRIQSNLFRNRLQSTAVAVKPAPVKRRIISKKCSIVTLGTSTGGPLALNQILPEIPSGIGVPILIVQHMPPTFTGPFAARLDSLCQVPVKEAEDGDLAEPGCIYVAPGGIHMKAVMEGISKVRIKLDPKPADLLFVPSVDEMMLSVANNLKMDILGVIMTGMGSDGLLGMRKIREKGGVTIAQNEESCVVYGMPKVCVDENIIDHVVDLSQIPKEIVQYSA